MARPIKQTVDYFPHDAHASSGDTLTVLESRFGNDGYTFWFKLLERLAATDGHYIDCRNMQKWLTLLSKSHVNEATGESIMVLLLEMEAIDKELWKSRVIWCQHLVDNLADVYSNRRKPLPQKPVITPNNLVSTPNNTNEKGLQGVETPQSKVKESKVKESKVNIPRLYHGEFLNVLLSDEEHGKLIERFGIDKTKELIESLSFGIKSKGYKYKDHYATILNWSRRDNGNNGGNGNGRTGTNQFNPRELPTQYTDPDELRKSRIQ